MKRKRLRLEGTAERTGTVTVDVLKAFIKALPSLGKEQNFIRYCQTEALIGQGQIPVLKGITLTGKTIGQADLSESQVPSATMTDITWEGTTLRKTNFMDSVFNRSHIIGADATGIDLTDSTFNQGSITNTNASQAGCINAVFTDVKFSGSNMMEADFNDAVFKGECNFDGAVLINAQGINLQSPLFDNAIKTEAELCAAIEAGIPAERAYAYRTAVEKLLDQNKEAAPDEALLEQQGRRPVRSSGLMAQLQGLYAGFRHDFGGLPPLENPRRTLPELPEMKVQRPKLPEETKERLEKALQQLKKKHPYASLRPHEWVVKNVALAIPAMGVLIHGEGVPDAPLNRLPTEVRELIASFVPGPELTPHQAQRLARAVSHNRLLVPEGEVAVSKDKKADNTKNQETLRNKIKAVLEGRRPAAQGIEIDGKEVSFVEKNGLKHRRVTPDAIREKTEGEEGKKGR